MSSYNKYHYKTFEDVFYELCNNYETQYGIDEWSRDGISYLTINKLTISNTGTIEYKGGYSTFDPTIWPRISLIAKIINKSPTVDLFYLK